MTPITVASYKCTCIAICICTSLHGPCEAMQWSGWDVSTASVTIGNCTDLKIKDLCWHTCTGVSLSTWTRPFGSLSKFLFPLHSKTSMHQSLRSSPHALLQSPNSEPRCGSNERTLESSGLYVSGVLLSNRPTAASYAEHWRLRT